MDGITVPVFRVTPTSFISIKKITNPFNASQGWLNINNTTITTTAQSAGGKIRCVSIVGRNFVKIPRYL